MVTLALTTWWQHSAGTVLVCAHQWAETYGDMWQSQTHSREELFELCKASSDHTAQCSALQGHTGRQKVSPPPQCPKLRHPQWCPGAWHSAASLPWAQQGQLCHVPLRSLSPDCWDRAVRASRTLEQSSTVRDRPVDSGVLRCSGIQKGKWHSTSSWTGRKAGQ